MYDFESHPHIQPAPAPWTLNGSGYILLFRFGRRFHERHAPPFGAHAGRLRLGVGCVMLVDYATSGAGPYRELLLMPGIYQYGRRFHPSITHIYVSTWASIVNGHVNWGIPKEHADFHIESLADGSERIRVSREDRPVADLHLRPWGLHLPVNTALVPRPLRTVAQPYRGKVYRTDLGGKGRMRPARLLSARVDNGLFPDFSDTRLLAAVKVVDFTLNFPVPRIEPCPPAAG